MSNLTKNTKLNAWLDEMIAHTNPANVVLIDGTDEQAEALRAEACVRRAFQAQSGEAAGLLSAQNRRQ